MIKCRLGRTYSPKPFGQASLRHAALTPTGIQETRSVSALDIVKPNNHTNYVGFRSSNATDYNALNPRKGVAPQPTNINLIISNHPNLILSSP